MTGSDDESFHLQLADLELRMSNDIDQMYKALGG